MKLVGDTLMLVIGLTLVLGGVVVLGGNRPVEANRPAPPTANTATVYVGGPEGEAYWMKWGDFSGALGGRKEGIFGSEPSAYELDLSKAPADGSDALEVRANKLEAWEGNLTLVVEVGDESIDLEDTSETAPNIAELYVSHRLGS
ncbi:MAG: hypothetical protein ACR2JR_03450 [Rubrobacteraceae bacterium]